LDCAPCALLCSPTSQNPAAISASMAIEQQSPSRQRRKRSENRPYEDVQEIYCVPFSFSLINYRTSSSILTNRRSRDHTKFIIAHVDIRSAATSAKRVHRR
jgi:hypothetical protein